MNSIEMTDIDGDALTLITRDGNAWITCTSGADEVTVGPFPLRTLRRALHAEAEGHEQVTTTFIGASVPTSNHPDGPQELHLLPPMSARTESVQSAPRTRREG